MGLIPGLERSLGDRNGNPPPVFLPGESHGQRKLMGHSPWGHKESDLTERPIWKQDFLKCKRNFVPQRKKNLSCFSILKMIFPIKCKKNLSQAYLDFLWIKWNSTNDMRKVTLTVGGSTNIEIRFRFSVKGIFRAFNSISHCSFSK